MRHNGHPLQCYFMPGSHRYSDIMTREIIVELFRQKAINITDARIYILSLIASSHKMMSQYELIKLSAKKINRITVYRTLSFFCEMGLIYKILDYKNKPFYALDIKLMNAGSAMVADAGTCNDHYHFKCLSCGSFVCLPFKYTDMPLPHGFVKTNANLLLMGYCAECSPQLERIELKENV